MSEMCGSWDRQATLQIYVHVDVNLYKLYEAIQVNYIVCMCMSACVCVYM